MTENILFMQTEDGMVTFERQTRETIIYPLDKVPSQYHEGNLIRAIVHDEDNIEFIELVPPEETAARREAIHRKSSRLRWRAHKPRKM